ncbi:hypothetical protein D9M71_456680 [compost metagenome]
MGWVDVYAKTGVALEQFQGGGGQLALVLLGVLAIDDQQRLVAGEWVGAHAGAILVAGRRRQQAALVGRDRAIGIAGLFRADGGQAGAQARGLVSGNGGLCSVQGGQ